jgi:hypothetical protein
MVTLCTSQAQLTRQPQGHSRVWLKLNSEPVRGADCQAVCVVICFAEAWSYRDDGFII